MDAGVHTWKQWQQRGVTRSQLRAGLNKGRFTRPRPGWYAVDTADPEAVEAVSRRGALSCLSVLERYGVWIPECAGGLHVRGDAQSHRLRSGRFCTQFGRPEPVRSAVDDPLTALRHALRCLDPEGITVVCDSLLNTSRRALAGDPVTEILTPTEVASAFHGAPNRVVDCFNRCDDRAESGTETMIRLRLRSRNVKVNVQVPLPGIGRVDLLVGERLVVEADSVAHHTGIERYRMDRKRDQQAARLGLLHMRLTYENVVYEWAETENTIMSIVRDGLHRVPWRRR